MVIDTVHTITGADDERAVALMVMTYSALNALILGALLAATLRRILGPGVGWGRAIAVGVLAVLAAGPAVSALAVPLGLFTSDGRQLASDAALMAFTALAALWMVGLAAMALLMVQVLAPTGSLPSPLAAGRATRAWMRRMRRSHQIAGVMLRSGLARAMRRGPGDDQFARALVTVLNRAGVTFVKLGQFMATRADVVPPSLAAMLATLHSDALSVDTNTIHQVLADEWGPHWRQRVAAFDDTPMAAASVAQVHRATLPDGTPVVVKVQRPYAAAQVSVDIDIMCRYARSAQRRFQWADAMSLSDLVSGFARSLTDELDYRIEAQNLALMHAVLADFPQIHTPAVYPELSTARVLVMDEIQGATLDRPANLLTAMTADQRRTANRQLLRAVLHTIMVAGIFHADLHPGNIMVMPDGQLALLDLGSVAVLDDETRLLLATLLNALLTDDSVTATAATLMVFSVPDRVDTHQLRRDIGREAAILAYRDTLDAGGLRRVATVLTRHHITIPGDIAAALRTLATIEESLVTLDPEASLIAGVREAIPTLIADSLHPRQTLAKVAGTTALSAATARRLPERIESTTRQLAAGTFTMGTRVVADKNDRRWITSTIGEVGSVILACAATLAAVVLIVSDTGPRLTTSVGLHPYLGFVLLFAGIILAFRATMGLFTQPSRRQESTE